MQTVQYQKDCLGGFKETVASVTVCGDDIQHPSLKCHQKNPQLHFNKSRETEQTITQTDTQPCV